MENISDTIWCSRVSEVDSTEVNSMADLNISHRSHQVFGRVNERLALDDVYDFLAHGESTVDCWNKLLD